jgi:hypothetical protein
LWKVPTIPLFNNDRKFSIPLAFVSPWISMGLYLFVALLWLVPDRRIEKRLGALNDSQMALMQKSR